MNDFNAQHKENSKQRKIQYTVVYVETLSGESHGQQRITKSDIYKGENILQHSL